MGIGGEPGGGKQGTDFDAEVSKPVSPEVIERERAEAEPQTEGKGEAEETAEPTDAERVKELESRVIELEGALAEARAAVASASRKAEIERALTAAGAIDLEITTPLVEQVVSGMDEPDVGKAVRDVRAGKSFLFRTAAGGGVKSEAMAGDSAVAGSGLDDLASDAKASGERGDLLRYLRARRH